MNDLSKEKGVSLVTDAFGIRRRPIFPGRRQPGIVGARELNFCVRNGNRCGLSAISTGMVEGCTLKSHIEVREMS